MEKYANDRPAIDDNSVLLSLRLSKPGNRRKVKSGVVTIDADADAVHVAKDLIDSKAYQAISTFDGATVNLLARRALPASAALRAGIWRISYASLPDMVEILKGCVTQRQALVETFCAEYPEQVEKAEGRLRQLFNPDDYPSIDRVRSAFKMDWQVFVISIPEALARLAPNVYQQTQERMTQYQEDSLRECQEALRTSFAAVIRRAADRLQLAPDGKPLVFRDSLVTGMEQFLASFQARNLADDQELAILVEEARAVMSRVPDAQALRTDFALRGAVQKTMQAISSVLDDGMVPDTNTRKIRFDVPEEPQGITSVLSVS